MTLVAGRNPASRFWPDWPRDVIVIEEERMPRTIRERLITALEGLGFVQVETRSTRYVALRGRIAGVHQEDVTYLVGRAGALRFKVGSGSIPCSDALKRRLLGE